MATTVLLAAATTTATGETIEVRQGLPRTYQAQVEGTGAVTATVLIEGTNDPAGAFYETIVTFTLSGTTNDHGGYAAPANWTYVRARISAISGTGATVNVRMGA